jgi:hypothetical protein
MKRIRQVKQLSYSQINCFQWCKKQWELKYLEKIRLEEKPQALAFGIAVHRGIEKYLRNYYFDDRPQIALSNGLSAFDYSYMLSDNKGPDIEVWTPIGQRMIEGVIDKLEGLNFHPSNIELFRRISCDGFDFVGKIDCYGEIEGRYTIIDWKTANKPYTKKKVENNDQLTAYAWLMDHTATPSMRDVGFMVMTKPPDSKVYWHPSTRDNNQIRQFEQLVSRTHEEMETRQDFPGKHRKNVCKWCEYAYVYCRADGDF